MPPFKISIGLCASYNYTLVVHADRFNYWMTTVSFWWSTHIISIVVDSVSRPVVVVMVLLELQYFPGRCSVTFPAEGSSTMPFANSRAYAVRRHWWSQLLPIKISPIWVILFFASRLCRTLGKSGIALLMFMFILPVYSSDPKHHRCRLCFCSHSSVLLSQSWFPFTGLVLILLLSCR